MIYEILIIAKERAGFSAKKGEIAACYPKGHKWSETEKSDRFAIIEFDGNESEISELSKGYRYLNGKFFNKENEEFDRALIFKVTDVPETNKTEREKWAELIDFDWKKIESSPCKFLHANYLGFDIHEPFDYIRTRLYWFNKFSKLKHLEGIKPFLAATLYADYGKIGQLLHGFKAEVKQQVLASDVFTEDDKNYISWLGRYGN